MNEISSWIQAALEGTAAEDLATRVTRRCQEAVREYEIWVPLFQVHASDSFAIGDVAFQKLTPAVMDCFFNHPPPGPVPDAVRIRRERLRSQLQNHVAACVKVTAEKETARAIARSKAERTIALLRFLSPANQTPDIQSYCVPLGRERIEIPTELFVENGEIRQISRGTIEHGPVFWDIDPERVRLPGLLERLDSLARDHASDYRRHLYDALLLYSRNSVASETTDKLVFILVSLESKDHLYRSRDRRARPRGRAPVGRRKRALRPPRPITFSGPTWLTEYGSYCVAGAFGLALTARMC